MSNSDFEQPAASGDDAGLGLITVNHNVIATIARTAALKIPGIHDMSASIVDGLAGILTKGSTDRGIMVEEEDQGFIITINIVVAFGVRIPDLALQLQNEVRAAVEEMTGKNVKQINVVVKGLHTPEPTEKEMQIS